jgi:hypothetical protein
MKKPSINKMENLRVIKQEVIKQVTKKDIEKTLARFEIIYKEFKNRTDELFMLLSSIKDERLLRETFLRLKEIGLQMERRQMENENGDGNQNSMIFNPDFDTMTTQATTNSNKQQQNDINYIG